VDSHSQDCKTERLPPWNEQLMARRLGDLGLLEATNAEVVRGLAKQGNYSHHRGVSGFKMYDEIDSCCEACTISRNCKMWSIPGSDHYDNCELYFDRLEDDVDFLDRNDGHYLGRDRSYSYTKQDPSDFPSIRRKLSFREHDNNSRRKLAISPDEIDKMWPSKEPPSKGFPRAGAVTPYFIGCGWSSILTFEHPCHHPSDDLVFGSGMKVSILSATSAATYGSSAAEDPPSCLLDDEKLDVSNGRWVQYPYPDASVCSEMVEDTSPAGFRSFRPQYRSDEPPHCWYREDLSKIATSCAETGCTWVIKHRWMTDLKRETQWFGMWEPYDCGYRIMGDDEIQQCIDQKNISKIDVRGASISEIVTDYMSQKLQRINMTDETTGMHSVVLDTLKMPHVLWHMSVDEWRKNLESFPDMSDSEDEYYWVTGFYYTSEREPHVRVDRSLQYSKLAWDILTPKGYKMINAFDLSAAFAFDTDGQADGMHILGPPPKAVITKFFHHLCHQVVAQS